MNRMLTRHTRLAAFLLALTLMMTLGLTALAQATLPGMIPAISQRGNLLKTEVEIDLNADTLIRLLEEHILTPGTQDAEGMQEIRDIVAGINKLRATIIQGDHQSRILLKSEDEQILTFDVILDADTQLASITSSLLPGVRLSLPQEMLLSAVKQQQADDPLSISAERVAPYAEAVTQFLAQLPDQTPETPDEGNYFIIGYGRFNKRETFDLDAKTALGLMASLLEVFKQDTQSQQMLDLSLKAQHEENPAEQQAFSSSADLISQLDKAIQEGQAQENRVIANHASYTRADGLALYTHTEFLSQDASQPNVLLNYYHEGNENQTFDITRFTITIDHPESSPEHETTLSLTSYTSKDEAQNDEYRETTATLDSSMGQFTLTTTNLLALTGDYGAQGTISLSAFGNKPLATLRYASQEVAQAPALPETAGLVTIDVGDSVSDEEGNLIAQTLVEKGLPDLFTALPEEMTQLLGIVLE
jgi:hypothetical protein